MRAILIFALLLSVGCDEVLTETKSSTGTIVCSGKDTPRITVTFDDQLFVDNERMGFVNVYRSDMLSAHGVWVNADYTPVRLEVDRDMGTFFFGGTEMYKLNCRVGE